MAIRDASTLHNKNIIEMDDFKVFPGIGPGVENRLHAAGILTYQQLAALSPEDLARILSDMVGFSVERIVQQDWIGQARQMADEIQGERSTNQQHYAVFTLELLLDKENTVRRTRVMHVQSQQEETWAGWDDQRLIRYYVDLAGLNVKSPDVQDLRKDQEPMPKEIPQEHLARQRAVESLPAQLSGRFHLLEMEADFQRPRTSRWMLPEDQPVIIRLKLDLSELETAGDIPLNYSAMVYSKELGTGSRLMVGSSSGRITPAVNNIIEIECQNLNRGIHRLDAFVTLAPQGREPKPDFDQVAFLDGGLYQVY